MRLLIFLLALAALGTGCRSRSEAPEKVRVSMDINIQEAAPPPAPAVRVPPKKTPARPKADAPVKKAKTPAANKKSGNPSLFKPLVPPAAGAFDSELNSVERAYINDVRRKSEKATRDSEAKVFGSYSPGALFKQPAKKPQ